MDTKGRLHGRHEADDSPGDAVVSRGYATEVRARKPSTSESPRANPDLIRDHA